MIKVERKGSRVPAAEEIKGLKVKIKERLVQHNGIIEEVKEAVLEEIQFICREEEGGPIFYEAEDYKASSNS